MKTYLEIYVHSEGSSPSQIKSHLLNLGFKATKGNYDFVYEWDTDQHDVDELVRFADKVHHALKGHHVFFHIETV